MTPDTLEHLQEYSWPGNIRQLMNAVEFLINIHEDHKLVHIENLPDYLQDEEPVLEGGLIQDVLGKDLVWVLEKLRAYGSIGRRHLAELAELEHPHLTVSMIRSLLLTTESLGFTMSGRGRRGSTITEKGRLVTKQWKLDV